ncbi:MAG: SRPBCC family protein [Aquihabitans sp.]
MTFTPHTLDPELDLELVREIDVAPELVWRAWTEPELIKQWFAPAPWSISDASVDLRPGGAMSMTMQSPEGEAYPNTGCYLEVVPNERLVWTESMDPGFRPKAADLPLTAILELEPLPNGGTRYRAVALHQDPAGVKQHEEMGFHEGWGAALDQLVALMSQP